MSQKSTDTENSSTLSDLAVIDCSMTFQVHMFGPRAIEAVQILTEFAEETAETLEITITSMNSHHYQNLVEKK